MKEILELTHIKECSVKVPREKKEMTVRDFIDNYEQGSTF